MSNVAEARHCSGVYSNFKAFINKLMVDANSPRTFLTKKNKLMRAKRENLRFKILFITSRTAFANFFHSFFTIVFDTARLVMI